MTPTITTLERKLAEQCISCKACNRARETQSGLSFWMIRKAAKGLCPACRAYEKVYGLKAHQKNDALFA